MRVCVPERERETALAYYTCFALLLLDQKLSHLSLVGFCENAFMAWACLRRGICGP